MNERDMTDGPEPDPDDAEANLVALIERGVVALEAIAGALGGANRAAWTSYGGKTEPDNDPAPTSAPMDEARDSEPPAPRPSQRAGTVVDLPVVRSARTRGSSQGVSNLLYYTAAPIIVQRLLRDDRAIRDGVLTTTLDTAAELGRESRTRVLARMKIEGLVTLSDTKKGQPAMVRVVDAARARGWLESLNRSETEAAP